MTIDPLGPGLSLDDARELIKWENSYSSLPAMIALSFRLEHSDWLTLFGEGWSCFDNIAQHFDDLAEDTPFGDLLECPSLGRLMMNAAEREALAKLPEVVTIWRGCYAFNKWGLSWSLEPSVASGFPFLHRYCHDGEQALLVKATVPRKEIIALKLDRSEAEVIVHRPKHLSTVHLSRATA